MNLAGELLYECEQKVSAALIGSDVLLLLLLSPSSGGLYCDEDELLGVAKSEGEEGNGPTLFREFN